MKKWVILILVVLGGLMLALQYMMNKKPAGTAGTTATGQTDPDGVPLPAGATGYTMPEIPFAPPTNDLSDPSKLNIPVIASDYKGACEGGALTDMIATHNKYWGRLAKETPFVPNDTKRMYGFAADYVACVAVARDNAVICDTLPPEPPQKGTPKPGTAAGAQTKPAPPERGSIKTRARDGLRYNCRKRVNPILFFAYMAGKSKNPDSCNAMLAGWKPPTLAMISATDFCSAASKGMEAVNEYMQKIMSEKKKKVKKDERSKQRYTASESSCNGNKECINGAKLYNAIKSGNAAQCPPAQQRQPPPGEKQSGSPPQPPATAPSGGDIMCQAAITRSALACEPIIKSMSGFYCEAIARTKKKTGGFIGMSKSEIEDAIARRKIEQVEEAKQKKEFDKMGVDINKKVKKLLGKDKVSEGGE